jgi:hypothetical protein
MAQYVDVDNVGRFEFPDDLSQDEIKSAIDKKLQSMAPAKQATQPQNNQQNSSLLDSAKQAGTGAVDAFKNVYGTDVENIFGANKPQIKNGDGLPYEIGNVAGTGAAYLIPASRITNALKLASQATRIPSLVSKGASFLVNTPWGKALKAAAGNASFGALVNNNDRVKGAELGGVLGLGGEVLSPVLKGNGLMAAARRALVGSGVGATLDSNDPLTGAATGALTSLGADTVLPLANTSVKGLQALSKRQFNNNLLNNIYQKSQKNLALTPEKAAENTAMNYTDKNGNLMPADIGSIANEASLMSQYNTLSKIPFSGAQQKQNQVANLQAQNKVEPIQNELNNANANLNENQLMNNEFDNPNAAVNYQKTLNQLTNKKTQNNEILQRANNNLNSLTNGVPNKTNIRSFLSNATKNAFKNATDLTEAQFKPLNDSKIRLDKLDPNNEYPLYRSAATKLMAEKDNLLNMVDSDSDLGKALNSEIDKANVFLNPDKKNDIPAGKDYGVTLNEAVKRVQNINKLGASLGKKSNYLQSLIYGLGGALKKDSQNILTNSGNEDLSNQWDVANQSHIEHVLPFYQDSNLYKAAKTNMLPKANALADSLHDLNNRTVYEKLPQDVQKAALFQLITRDKNINSSGLSNLKHEDISSNYNQKVSPEIKSLIKDYHPDVNDFLESLPGKIDENKNIDNQLDNLSELKNYRDKQQALSETQLAKQKIKIQQIQDKLNLAKNKEFGVKQQDQKEPSKIMDLIKMASAPAMIAGSLIHPLIGAGGATALLGARALESRLTNPELIRRYTSGDRGRPYFGVGANNLGDLVDPAKKILMANILQGAN